MHQPRLRVFAGPNGSGKSTFFESFSKLYDTGTFLNADLIEQELSTKGFIDLTDYNISANQKQFEQFLKTPRAKSLIEKSLDKGYQFDIYIDQKYHS